MLNRLQLYLSLARASNLPTVWTNAVAAWAVVGQQFHWWPLIWLSLAGSLLYAGGCTLNDAFDAKWDAERRPERPIPSDKLSAQEVWLVGLLELALGLAVLGKFGLAVLASGGLVVVAILLYDWLHKKSPWAVLLMAWCRAQWVATAGLAVFYSFDATLQGTSLITEGDRMEGSYQLAHASRLWVHDSDCWSPDSAHNPAHFLTYALILFGYIVFISLTARKESQQAAQGLPVRKYSFAVRMVLLLAAGLCILAQFSGHPAGSHPESRPAFCLFILWFISIDYKCLQSKPPNIGRFVGLALAGITLLDTVFACLAWSWSGLWLALMLPLCLLLQRRIAAT